MNGAEGRYREKCTTKTRGHLEVRQVTPDFSVLQEPSVRLRNPFCAQLPENESSRRLIRFENSFNAPALPAVRERSDGTRCFRRRLVDRGCQRRQSATQVSREHRCGLIGNGISTWCC